MLSEKSKIMLVLFIFAAFIGFAVVTFTTTQAKAQDCVTCSINFYYDENAEKCYIDGINCLPEQSVPGQYYIVYRPEDATGWYQYMLSFYMILCEDGCDGYTFKAALKPEVACDENSVSYVDYFFFFDAEGTENDEFYCGHFFEPSRVWKDLG